MIILGLDPGLATLGYGIIEKDERGNCRAVDCGVVVTPKEEALPVRLAMLEQGINKILDKYKTKKLLFEFFSGMFLVLLSTPCMAPYLGTAMGVALAGSIGDIWVIILTVCVGLALPYILITIWPSIALSVPKPGKWMDSINLLMVLMLMSLAHILPLR